MVTAHARHHYARLIWSPPHSLPHARRAVASGFRLRTPPCQPVPRRRSRLRGLPSANPLSLALGPRTNCCSGDLFGSSTGGTSSHSGFSDVRSPSGSSVIEYALMTIALAAPLRLVLVLHSREARLSASTLRNQDRPAAFLSRCIIRADGMNDNPLSCCRP